jgi:hypothetical protein
MPGQGNVFVLSEKLFFGFVNGVFASSQIRADIAESWAEGWRRMRTLVDDVDPQGLYVVKMPAAAPIHGKVRICFGEPKLEQGEEVLFGPSTRDQVQAFIDGLPYPLSEGSPSVDTVDPNESDRFTFGDILDLAAHHLVSTGEAAAVETRLRAGVTVRALLRERYGVATGAGECGDRSDLKRFRLWLTDARWRIRRLRA